MRPGSSPVASSLLVSAVRQSFLQPVPHHCWRHLVPMSTLKLVQWLQCTVHVRRGCAGDLLECHCKQELGTQGNSHHTINVQQTAPAPPESNQRATETTWGQQCAKETTPCLCSRSGLTLRQDARTGSTSCLSSRTAQRTCFRALQVKTAPGLSGG